MPQGLQIWDISGNLDLDTSSETQRVISSIDIPANTVSSVTITKTSNEKIWGILIPKSTTANGGTASMIYANTSAPGTPLAPGDTSANGLYYDTKADACILFYGVYV